MREGGSLQRALSWNTEEWGVSYPLLAFRDHRDQARSDTVTVTVTVSLCVHAKPSPSPRQALAASRSALPQVREDFLAPRMAQTDHGKLEVVPWVHLQSRLCRRYTTLEIRAAQLIVRPTSEVHRSPQATPKGTH